MPPLLVLAPAAYGVLLLGAGAFWLATGVPFDPGTYERIGGLPWPELGHRLGEPGTAIVAALIRLLGGNGAILAGALVLAVALFGYRRRLRWAWLALWLLPLHASIDLLVMVAAGGAGLAGALWDGAGALAVATSLVVARRRGTWT